MQTDGVVEGGIAPFRGAQNVGGQTAVSSTGLDQIETLKSEFRTLKYLGELDFQELSEQRAHIDARKKTARAPRTLGGAGVVAERGIVEREIHERGHRHGAA